MFKKKSRTAQLHESVKVKKNEQKHKKMKKIVVVPEFCT